MTTIRRQDCFAALSLVDAAYYLWAEKRSLDRDEFPSRPGPYGDLSSPEAFQKAVTDAFSAVENSYRTAHEGPTFDRLKRLRPDVSDNDLREAVKRAVRFDRACIANFSYNAEHDVDDCKRAVSLAAIEVSGFSAETLIRAEQKLRFETR